MAISTVSPPGHGPTSSISWRADVKRHLAQDNERDRMPVSLTAFVALAPSTMSSPTNGLTFLSHRVPSRWPRKHWRPCGAAVRRRGPGTPASASEGPAGRPAHASAPADQPRSPRHADRYGARPSSSLPIVLIAAAASRAALRAVACDRLRRPWTRQPLTWIGAY